MEVPGSASVGEVPVRGHGEVPVSSSPVEVPGAGSDSGGSDEDLDQSLQPERVDSDDAAVAARVLANATGFAAKLYGDKIMIRHKTRLTVHRVSIDPARIACGRWVNSNFEVVLFFT